MVTAREKQMSEYLAQFIRNNNIESVEQLKLLLEQPEYYVVLPVAVLELKNISSSAKLLYAEIVVLSKKTGWCNATNKYLGEKIGLSGETVKQLIKELKDNSLIDYIISRNKGTWRKIKVTWFPTGAKGRVRVTRRVGQKPPDKKDSLIKLKKESKEPDDSLLSFKEELNAGHLSDQDRLQAIKALFIERVKAQKNFDYLCTPKDDAAAKSFIQIINPPDYNKLIHWFMDKCKKSQDHLSLSSCLSKDTVNQYNKYKYHYGEYTYLSPETLKWV